MARSRIELLMVVATALLLVGGCRHSHGKGGGSGSGTAAHAPADVPHTTGPIVTNGERDEPDWNARSERHLFVDDTGGEARPYSEVRFLRDDHFLYLGLYAADEDIHGDEEFVVTIGDQTLHFRADGGVVPKLAGMTSGIDRDGTLDVPGDFDEEWVIEAAIPLSTPGLGLPGKTKLTASRCDVTKSGERRCGHLATTLSVP
jgi:hypothetical protein